MKQSVGSVLLVRKELADWIRTGCNRRKTKTNKGRGTKPYALRVPVLKDGHPGHAVQGRCSSVVDVVASGAGESQSLLVVAAALPSCRYAQT